MTRRILPLLLFSITTLTWAQTVQNPGFEMPRDTSRTLPASWGLNKSADYVVVLDSTVARSGRRSLNIASLVNAPTSTRGFSQSCVVQMSKPTLVHLRGFVKTDNPAGVGIWWNAWRDKRHLGFANLQQSRLQGTGEWRTFDIILPVMPEANRFTFGAFMDGRGSAWFDDFTFEVPAAGSGAPSAKAVAYLRKAKEIVRKHALVRDSIPWPQVEREMMAFAGGMQTEQETYPVTTHLLTIMYRYGDNHSHFLSPDAAKDLKADESTDEGPFTGERPQPKARYLDDEVGYVAVPRFWGVNKKRETDFATQIQTLIRRVDSAHTVRNWVIDLRGNTGGNVWPMVAGLVPLYGKDVKAIYKRVTKVPQPYRLRNAPDRVAVLMDEKTGSSGEFTALSFIGLPNVRSFGTHSAGYTTGNAGYSLPDGAMLFIASSVGEDRSGRKYPHGIAPDEEIKSPATDTADPVLDAARAWLVKK